MITTLAQTMAAVAVLDAVINDVRSFRIPNRVPTLLVLSWTLAAAADPEAMGWGGHLAAGAIAFAAGALLFSAGLWGGGDAKMLPALALWVGLADLPRFLLVMSLAGGVLAALALVARRAPLAPSGPLRHWGQAMAASGHVPYGVAMGAAAADWLIAASL